MNLSTHALNANRIQEAETAFQNVLAQTPQDPDALGGLGLVRLRQGNVAEARTLLSRAIAADPPHKARWEAALQGASVGEDYAAARTMIQRGQLDAAERQLRAILASGGDVGGAQLMLADVLSRRGDLSGAETQYRDALTRQPNNADALVGLAQILNRQGRNTDAEALLDRAQSSGNSRVVQRLRGDGLRQQAAAATDPVARRSPVEGRFCRQPKRPLDAAGFSSRTRQGRQEGCGPAGDGRGHHQRQSRHRRATGGCHVRGRGW